MYQETRARGSDILDNLPGLNAARDAQAAIVNDSEPLRKELETVQEQLGSEAGLSGLILLLLLLSAVLVASAVPASCACTSPSRASAPRWRRTGASRPRARRRKPSASTTPTRRRSCG